MLIQRFMAVGQLDAFKSGPEVINIFFMLNSAEHEILKANNFENI